MVPPTRQAAVWALDLSGAGDELGEFLGLRLNGSREMRAKSVPKR